MTDSVPTEFPSWDSATGASVAAVVVVGADGMIRKVSLHDSAAVFGWTESDLIDTSGPQLIHPDDREFAARMRQAALEGTTRTGEIRVRAASGRWVWAECSWRSEAGRDDAREVVVSIRDVSTKYLDHEAMAILADLRSLISEAADVDEAWRLGLDAAIRFGNLMAARAWVRHDDALVVRAEVGIATPGPQRSLSLTAHDGTAPHHPVPAAWLDPATRWVTSVVEDYSRDEGTWLADQGYPTALVIPVGTPGPAAVIELFGSTLSDTASATHLATEVAARLGDVIERKELESELTRIASEFRLSFEEAAIGMALVAPDGSLLRVNEALCRLLDRDPGEMLTLDFQTITHADDLDLDLANVEAMLAGEIRSYQMEKRYLRPDGQVVWALLSVSLVRDQKGEPLHFISQIQDISARKEAERLLEESTARFRAAFDDSAVGMAVIEVTGARPGRVVETNSAVRMLTRLSGDQLCGAVLSDLVAPESSSLLAEALGDLGVPGAVHNSEHQLAGAGTEDRWVRITASPIAHAESDQRFAVVQMEDITEQRRTREDLAHRALHDPLTGLANRQLVAERLGHALLRSERSGSHVGLMFLDLDRFKAVNDLWGHDQGDQLLCAIAERILSCLRPSDTAGRFGGDEFVLVCDDLAADPATAQRELDEVAERIGAAVAIPVPLASTTAEVSASIGLTLTSGSGHSVTELLAHADMAMYQAKRRGRARHEWYEEDPGARPHAEEIGPV